MHNRGFFLISSIALFLLLGGCASTPPIPPVEIRYSSAELAPDLVITAVRATASRTAVSFTIVYSSSLDRRCSFFNPPRGDLFLEVRDLPARGRTVSVTLAKSLLRQVSFITIKFWPLGGGDSGALFLNFADISPLLGESMVSAQDSGQPNEAPYYTRLSSPGKLEIVRTPAPAQMRGTLSALPVYRPDSKEPWQVDVRSSDLSGLDLSGRLTDLLHADFDSRTRWPEKLPAGFVPSNIMALGRNPGLGMRALHAKGLTGKGVGIAIIDQALLVDHLEYKDRLRMYEEIHWMPSGAQMHAPAVASIAVGKTIGVAPEADLYFIAEWHGKRNASGSLDFVLAPLAQSIDRIVAVNRTLPLANRIRVISISLGINPIMGDYELVEKSIDAAAREGIYVVYVGSDPYAGMGRDSMADPDSFESWKAGQFWAGSTMASDRIMIPMDARCTASPAGTSDYVFYSEGGMSWTVPWVAGLYAIACQVKPSVTRTEFWSAAAATAVTNTAGFGKIINPEGLMTALAGRN